jgi:hypothetical protein
VGKHPQKSRGGGVNYFHEEAQRADAKAGNKSGCWRPTVRELQWQMIIIQVQENIKDEKLVYMKVQVKQ